ncbi:tryptophan-rich sensory protein [Aureitalea sp. L0-47]|uniref:tryptophan-rich sensory protein n=1 Tax=Aureitalea sp. L0-47 TaxID=2816962 RepID=UPI002238787C|nr:tryptophan-rich sensory protein [Aureitalea sp. L0-47]MCW5519033.1 tryptophan-rich sensory protein [Aureitalea sp. L0-47]
MKKLLQVLNAITFVSVVVVNYFSNTGEMNNTTIGEVSGDLTTLFTPAGYAFSIWGVIYLFLLGFVIYQGRSLFVSVKDDDFILKTGGWFILSNLANAAWVFCWLYGYTAWSVVCIFLLLFSLLKIVVNNNMERWDAPLPVIAFLWWPFVIYSGWVTVACIANVSAWLQKIGWDGFGISETIWTVIMIVIAGIINFWITWSRNMREFALVGAWALVAIAIANWESNSTVKISALVVAAFLFLSSSYHGFINRATNPIEKLKALRSEK